MKTKEIIQWAEDRGILAHGTRQAQFRKTYEEVGELMEAIEKDDRALAKDAIGDVFVTLVIQAELWGFTIEECIDAAYGEIKDRKGYLDASGVFIKE